MPPKQFLEHYCEYQQDVMGFPIGKDCDWCGESAPIFNQKQHQKTVFKTLHHPQELLMKKILPVDVFYKLFGQKNE